MRLIVALPTLRLSNSSRACGDTESVQFANGKLDKTRACAWMNEIPTDAKCDRSLYNEMWLLRKWVRVVLVCYQLNGDRDSPKEILGMRGTGPATFSYRAEAGRR